MAAFRPLPQRPSLKAFQPTQEGADVIGKLLASNVIGRPAQRRPRNARLSSCQAAKQVRPFVEKTLKEQPMATLAGVAVLGFVLGALWKK